MLHYTYSNLYLESKEIIIKSGEENKSLVIEALKILGKIEDKVNYRGKLKWTV